jgi:hypothetical protein
VLKRDIQESKQQNKPALISSPMDEDFETIPLKTHERPHQEDQKQQNPRQAVQPQIKNEFGNQRLEGKCLHQIGQRPIRPIRSHMLHNRQKRFRGKQKEDRAQNPRSIKPPQGAEIANERNKK